MVLKKCKSIILLFFLFCLFFLISIYIKQDFKTNEYYFPPVISLQFNNNVTKENLNSILNVLNDEDGESVISNIKVLL